MTLSPATPSDTPLHAEDHTAVDDRPTPEPAPVTTETASNQEPLLVSAELWEPKPGELGFGPVDAMGPTGPDAVVSGLVAVAVEQKRPAMQSDVGEATVVMPTIEEGSVKAVLALRFVAEDGAKAAVELWSGTRGRFELSLADAFHPGMSRFATISQYVNFPKGSGLPGKVWEEASPRVMHNLGKAVSFLRSSGAETDGLTEGAGIPIIAGIELRSVLLLLSSEQTPVTRVLEVYEPTDTENPEAGLTRTGLASVGLKGWEALPPQLGPMTEFGPVRRAWADRKPVLLHDLEGLADQRRGMAVEGGVKYGVAIPVLAADRPRAVTLLLW
ncbi:MAG: GAF domain-containing protein [Planctomycetota bacterium]